MRPHLPLLIFCFLLVTACGRQDAATPTAAPSGQTLTHVTLALNWFPEMEHGGFYAALVSGEYARAGLDVTIMPGGAGTQPLPQLAAERVDFAIANADDVVLARAAQIPVAAILAPIQTSPRCIIVHAKSGITSFSQIKDVTLAMNVANPFAVFLQKNFPLTGVRIVPYHGNTAQFLLDPNYAQQGYLFSEPYILQSKGGDPRSLMLADAGFNPYTSMLVTTEAMLREKPELVAAMAKASAVGWNDYLADAAPANARIHELNPQLGMDVLQYGARTLHAMVRTSETQTRGTGSMTVARWEELIGKMEAAGLTKPGAVRPRQCIGVIGGEAKP